jgi:hypothetical protein
MSSESPPILVAFCLLQLAVLPQAYAQPDDLSDDPAEDYVVDPDIPSGKELEERGARIGRIFLDKDNVFDTSRED